MNPYLIIAKKISEKDPYSITSIDNIEDTGCVMDVTQEIETLRCKDYVKDDKKMPTRELRTEQEVRDFVRGCTFLGTGGGGSPHEGVELLLAFSVGSCDGSS